MLHDSCYVDCNKYIRRGTHSPSKENIELLSDGCSFVMDRLTWRLAPGAEINDFWKQETPSSWSPRIPGRWASNNCPRLKDMTNLLCSYHEGLVRSAYCKLEEKSQVLRELRDHAIVFFPRTRMRLHVDLMQLLLYVRQYRQRSDPLFRRLLILWSASTVSTAYSVLINEYWWLSREICGN